MCIVSVSVSEFDFFNSFLVFNTDLGSQTQKSINRIGGVMDSVLVSSAVDRRFESRSGQIKDYRIRICCFPENFTALRRKSKDKLTRNQDICVRVGRHVYPQTVVSVS
jgi:hypothetical protein